MSYTIRPLAPEEMPLVLKSWLSSLREDVRRRDNDENRVEHGVYYDGQRARCMRLVAASHTLAATVPGVPGEVIGWACVGPGVLHYAYTKAPYRRAGVLRALLTAAGLLPGGFAVSLWTSAAERWSQAGHPVSFNPYALDT